MANALKISVGQYSDKGRKDANQDFHGMFVPREPQLGLKGIAIALADGISSSDVSHLASQAAVTGFLEDYFCTSEAWTVKKSAQRVLQAVNSWLNAQTQKGQHRWNRDKGYVCTFSALVIKSATAHIFHVGDSRIYRLRDGALEQLTEDHRLWVSPEKSYLARALGMNPQIEIDYRTLRVETGDVFVLATDGVHEHVSDAFIVDALDARTGGPGGNLDDVAKRIAGEAFRQGSADNLTIQVIRVDDLPSGGVTEIQQQIVELPIPPALAARMDFDGYRIVRELHASSRSHVFLAIDGQTGAHVAIKTPATDQRSDPACLERMLMEEWIARRIDSAHVLKFHLQDRPRKYLYVVAEFIDGQTLAQWMIDHPKADLQTVRGILAQIAKGLQALHRAEIVHQDLRPANIMIDGTGTIRIIDFGSARVAGIEEITPHAGAQAILGSEQYSAPEYFLGKTGTSRSDIFSLGVVAYQMLTGELPYGTRVPKARTEAAQRGLKYRSARGDAREIPEWVDEAIRKAVHPDPYKRYAELSEFVFDLDHPNREFLRRNRPPLLERHPAAFWKAVALFLALVILFLAASHVAIK